MEDLEKNNNKTPLMDGQTKEDKVPLILNKYNNEVIDSGMKGWKIKEDKDGNLTIMAKEKDVDHPSDTTSWDDTDRPDDYAINTRKSRRNRRHNYIDFRKNNNKFWMWFNFLTAFFSGGFLAGTYMVLDNNGTDCGNLRFNMYLIICLHGVNIFMCLINLCKLEVKLCNQNAICGFVIFELSMLTFMQVTYFSS